MSDGQRVKIVAGPWPERIGCEGVIVEAPKGYDRYPWRGRGKSEVIVLLDDDPLSCEKRGCDHDRRNFLFCGMTRGKPAWTCAIGREDVETL